jgi:radical SAM protein with 4Fe4S-binding SPASM domain
VKSGFYFYLGRRLVGNKLRRKFGRASIPYRVLWNTTYYCNSRCQTCNIWQIYPANGGSQKDEIQRAEVSRVIGSLGKHLLWLTVTGGEPTLKLHMAETVNDIYDACPHLSLITVNTNGILPNPVVKAFERIASHCSGAKVVAVLSLDGVGKLHDEIRGIPGNFAGIEECCRRLGELKDILPNLQLAFQSTVSRHNLRHLPALLDYCSRHADDHALTFAQEAELYCNYGEGHDVTADRPFLSLVLDDLIPHFAVRHPRHLLQWSHMRLMRHFVQGQSSPVPCTAGSSTITIGPTGVVSGCLFLDNSMGNVQQSEYNLLRLLRTPQARSVQKSCSTCHQCWTNCESFPSMMSSPIKTLLRILSSRPKHTRAITGAADVTR